MFDRWERMVKDQKRRKEELKRDGRKPDEAKRVKNPHVKKPNFTRS